MAAIIVFDVNEFRAQFPEFADPLLYPTPVLQGYWDRATCYISDSDYGYLSGRCRRNAINLMTAHIATLSSEAADGELAVMLTAATVDKVNITASPPPLPNQWQWWLGTSIYGQQLLALLQVAAVGGILGFSLPELAPFRRVGGVFVP